MQKLFNFLMVGLTFVVLNVATVAAQAEINPLESNTPPEQQEEMGVMDPQGTSHDSKLSATDVDNSPTCRSECDTLHINTGAVGVTKETQACYDKFPNRKSPKCRHGGVN